MLYLFGAVCPSTGATEALISPFMNMEVMEQYLALISQKTKDRRHTVIIVDGAVWGWLRQHHLANSCFRDMMTSSMLVQMHGAHSLVMRSE